MTCIGAVLLELIRVYILVGICNLCSNEYDQPTELQPYEEEG